MTKIDEDDILKKCAESLGPEPKVCHDTWPPNPQLRILGEGETEGVHFPFPSSYIRRLVTKKETKDDELVGSGSFRPFPRRTSR